MFRHDQRRIVPRWETALDDAIKKQNIDHQTREKEIKAYKRKQLRKMQNKNFADHRQRKELVSIKKRFERDDFNKNAKIFQQNQVNQDRNRKAYYDKKFFEDIQNQMIHQKYQKGLEVGGRTSVGNYNGGPVYDQNYFAQSLQQKKKKTFPNQKLQDTTPRKGYERVSNKLMNLSPQQEREKALHQEMMKLTYDFQVKEKKSRQKNLLNDKISKRYDYSYLVKHNQKPNWQLIQSPTKVKSYEYGKLQYNNELPKIGQYPQSVRNVTKKQFEFSKNLQPIPNLLELNYQNSTQRFKNFRTNQQSMENNYYQKDAYNYKPAKVKKLLPNSFDRQFDRNQQGLSQLKNLYKSTDVKQRHIFGQNTHDNQIYPQNYRPERISPIKIQQNGPEQMFFGTPQKGSVKKHRMQRERMRKDLKLDFNDEDGSKFY